MNGYLTLAHKELWESMKTGRLLIAVVVFVLAGCGGVILTHYLPDLLRGQAGSGLTVIAARQTVADAVDAYIKNVSQIPVLAAILLVMGAVAEERLHGAGPMILSRPVSREAYLLAKLTGHGLTLLAGLALGAGAALYYIVIFFGGVAIGPYVLINLGLAVTLLDVLALTLLCSTLVRSAVGAGGLAFVLYLLYSTLPAFWSPLGASLPGAVTTHARDLLAGTWVASDLLRPLGGGLLLAALGCGLACLALRHMEV